MLILKYNITLIDFKSIELEIGRNVLNLHLKGMKDNILGIKLCILNTDRNFW